MQKLACLFSFKESNWVSCQKIVLNLHKSYQTCSELQLENFNYSEENSSASDLDTLANNILQYDPDVLVVMDHRPHPLPLLQQLINSWRGPKKPKIVFHIFGDFSLYYPLWDALGTMLQGFEVSFLVASERQKRYLDRMLSHQESIVCPFPVDEAEFYQDSSLRKKQRAQWNLTETDRAFLFTGRLSRQKRIKTLIRSFAQEFRDKQDAHLFIYGNADNIGDPFLQKMELEGEYFRRFYRVYQELPEKIKNRIHFMGAVPNSELQQVYQGADVLMNLSVHNDEDFGMSVAEAQFTGLPAILTDWGGLAGFEHPEVPKASHYIPVTIGTFHKVLNPKKVKLAMGKAVVSSPALRSEIEGAARKKFGIKAVGKIISKVISTQGETFKGFSPLLTKASLASQVNGTDPAYVNERGHINQLYRDIYSAYVR